MRSKAEIDDILKNVQAKLDARNGTNGVSLRVQSEYLIDDDWLNVIIVPNAPGMRAYQYVEALGEVERELKQDGVDHVLLVPAVAD